MNITNRDIIESIISGDQDDDLSKLIEVIRTRQSDIKDKEARMLRFTLKVGDTVIFNDTCKPTYLRGEKAIVKKFRTKKIEVDLLRPRGRFYKGIGCPLSLVSKA